MALWRILSFGNRPAAIDGKDWAGDESGSVGKKVDDGDVESLGFADATTIEMLFGVDEIHDSAIGDGALGHVCFHKGRNNQVDANVLWGVIGRAGFGKTDDGTLGRGVRVSCEKFGRG